MKKLLAIALVTLSLGAHAQWHPHTYGYRGYGYRGWVAPAVIGGIVTYELTRPPQTVVIQQPQVVQPTTPYGYHYENILDANCNCYRLVLVQN